MAPAPPLLEKGQQANFKPMNFGEYVKQQQERVVRGKSALDVVKMWRLMFHLGDDEYRV